MDIILAHNSLKLNPELFNALNPITGDTALVNAIIQARFRATVSMGVLPEGPQGDVHRGAILEVERQAIKEIIIKFCAGNKEAKDGRRPRMINRYAIRPNDLTGLVNIICKHELYQAESEDVLVMINRAVTAHVGEYTGTQGAQVQPWKYPIQLFAELVSDLIDHGGRPDQAAVVTILQAMHQFCKKQEDSSQAMNRLTGKIMRDAFAENKICYAPLLILLYNYYDHWDAYTHALSQLGLNFLILLNATVSIWDVSPLDWAYHRRDQIAYIHDSSKYVSGAAPWITLSILLLICQQVNPLFAMLIYKVAEVAQVLPGPGIAVKALQPETDSDFLPSLQNFVKRQYAKRFKLFNKSTLKFFAFMLFQSLIADEILDFFAIGLRLLCLLIVDFKIENLELDDSSLVYKRPEMGLQAPIMRSILNDYLFNTLTQITALRELKRQPKQYKPSTACCEELVPYTQADAQGDMPIDSEVLHLRVESMLVDMGATSAPPQSNDAQSQGDRRSNYSETGHHMPGGIGQAQGKHQGNNARICDDKAGDSFANSGASTQGLNGTRGDVDVAQAAGAQATIAPWTLRAGRAQVEIAMDNLNRDIVETGPMDRRGCRAQRYYIYFPDGFSDFLIEKANDIPQGGSDAGPIFQRMHNGSWGHNNAFRFEKLDNDRVAPKGKNAALRKDDKKTLVFNTAGDYRVRFMPVSQNANGEWLYAPYCVYRHDRANKPLGFKAFDLTSHIQTLARQEQQSSMSPAR